jgi:hypothetical protein
MMLKKLWGNYALTAVSLLALDWFLLWARFYWFGFGDVTKWIYTIVNFPWSLLYFWIEAKRNPWWYTAFGRQFEFLVNDEIGPLILFIIIVLLQAGVFTFIISSIRKLRDQRPGSKPHPV